MVCVCVYMCVCMCVYVGDVIKYANVVIKLHFKYCLVSVFPPESGICNADGKIDKGKSM